MIPPAGVDGEGSDSVSRAFLVEEHTSRSLLASAIHARHDVREVRPSVWSGFFGAYIEAPARFPRSLHLSVEYHDSDALSVLLLSNSCDISRLFLPSPQHRPSASQPPLPSIMGDYTRHSSQPATVDLVRGDLGEFWSTNGPEVESPRRSASVSVASAMLDLEPVATPRPRRSKVPRKDPLPGLLADILGSDTSSDEVPSPIGVEQTPAPRGQRPDSTKQPRANNKRTRPKAYAKAAESPRESPASSPHHTLPAGRAGASSNARKRPTRPAAQAKIRTQTAGQAPSRAKRKARKHDEDMYELSDATDTETERPPKKRRAKQPPSKEPRPPPRKPQAANEEAVRPEPAIAQTRKRPIRVAKKSAGRKDAPQEKKVEPESTSPVTSEASDPVGESDAWPVEDLEDTTATISQPNSKERSPVPPLSADDGVAPKRTEPATVPKPLPASSRDAEPVLPVASKRAVSPEPSKLLLAASMETEPILPIAPKAQEVIVLSSESDEDSFPPAGSTSPLFVERQGPLIASGSPEATMMVNPAISPDHGWEPRLPTSNTRIAPSTSLRAHTLPKHTTKPDPHYIPHALPAGIRDAFLSDEQPAATPPSPSPEVQAYPDEEDMSPGDVWEEAVDDGSLPGVLHKIITVSPTRRKLI